MPDLTPASRGLPVCERNGVMNGTGSGSGPPLRHDLSHAYVQTMSHIAAAFDVSSKTVCRAVSAFNKAQLAADRDGQG